ncbi:hypothetical protein F5Y17DRAFT_444593 [Xylariaceae sp. FL0594]|nr:hypothetical protein F5Y17DRAFT_444593 [Xylariaceae sp. FL0594]
MEHNDKPRPTIVFLSLNPFSVFPQVSQKLRDELAARAEVVDVTEGTHLDKILALDPEPDPPQHEELRQQDLQRLQEQLKEKEAEKRKEEGKGKEKERVRKKAKKKKKKKEKPEPPRAVLITDETITEKANVPIRDKVLEYIRKGGTAVVMGQFGSMVTPERIFHFFSSAGLPWRTGWFFRTTITLNRDTVGPELAAPGMLIPSYSLNARALRNVLYTDSWYVTTLDSKIENKITLSSTTATESGIKGQSAYIPG